MRLTNVMRRNIEATIITKTFEGRCVALEKMNTEIFHAILKELSPEDFKITPRNKTWFPTVSRIEVRGTASLHSLFSGDETPVPYCLVDRWSHSKITADVSKRSETLRTRIKHYQETKKNPARRQRAAF